MKTILGAFILVVSFSAINGGVFVEDLPNDDGSALLVFWNPTDNPEAVGYLVYRKDSPGEGFYFLGRLSSPAETVFVDCDPRYPLEAGMNVSYKIVAVSQQETELDVIGESDFFSSSASIFNKTKVNTFLAAALAFILIVYFINSAKKGKLLFIRKIAGLDALDEAVGRATEMGRPVLYVPGLSTMDDIATVASINILGPVSKKVAEYESTIIVPSADPIVYTVTSEVVKESYLEAGRPDAFNSDQVFFISEHQFAFVAAVNGIMLREKPATNLFLGMFWAESLLLAETGNSTGAIQIAGTDAVTQLPFFITSCDYTLIGEELYAASAYLSKDPVLCATIKAQDIEKGLIIVLLVALSALSVLNLFVFKSDVIWRLISAFFRVE
ncbi:hypothetical protein JXL83_05890 [candidate division WOR-3 bacterium]|nr:hypothetical protein [candidate division WOR-3 bacterium]